MGRVVIQVRLWNIADEEAIQSGEKEPLKREALIDTGATLLCLPRSVADALNLRMSGTARVRYADGRIEERRRAIGVRIGIGDRDATVDAIVEENGHRILVGQIPLEEMDLHVDPKNRRLLPSPESPDAPLLDLLIL